MKLPIRGGEFRGSGGPIPFEDGYLIAVHQVYLKEHKGRRYLHRFIKCDENLVPNGLSEAFYIKSSDIEYISTMIDTKDEILIGYGLCDRCACVSGISKKTISKMMRPIHEYY